MPEPLFNLHRLYEQKGDKTNSDEYAQKASTVAHAEVAQWMTDESRNHNQYVVDSFPSTFDRLTILLYRPNRSSVTGVTASNALVAFIDGVPDYCFRCFAAPINS